MTTSDVVRGAAKPYRNLWIALALLIPATVLAFGKSYFDGLTFSRLSVTTLVHVHAAFMALWLLMLVGQAWLIRERRYVLHRWVGRSSFVLVPIILATTLLAGHESLVRKESIDELTARFMIYDWLQAIGFGLAWVLAIVYRRRPPIHVRFMISTVLVMGNAIVFRILLSWFTWVPGLGGENIENVAAANGTILLLMVLGLTAMDWRLGIRRSPFWIAVITIGLIHVGLFTFTKTDWWMALVLWFRDLPL
ncbi:MAG: hypothetical protein ACYTJ0_09430 [Planctomycetota bacterium]|jgi:hypothetical protein